MATRSIIAVWGSEGYKTEPDVQVVSNKEWFGRYCHWDGYPDHMIPALLQIISLHGVVEAKRKLMANSWSSIYEDCTTEQSVGKPFGEIDPFIVAGDDDWGTEYRYVITDKGSILAYKSDGSFVTQVQAA
jgi:hypothetical protein